MGTTDSGLALLFSKLISRLFGLRAHPDWLVAHPVWIAGYLATMLTLAGGCVYGYHRLFGEKDEARREEYQEKVYTAPFAEYIDPEEDPRMGCVIRTYASLEGLRPCNAHYETCATPDVSAADIANSDLYAVFEPHKFGDVGSYYFYYNAEKNDRRVEMDCY